ncbi:uncharacterized protein METZ01_LOCUS370660, partial [marine metagenome]
DQPPLSLVSVFSGKTRKPARLIVASRTASGGRSRRRTG